MKSKPYHTYSFEKLEVWQLARVFRNEVYRLSKKFPKSEMFGLTGQIRRAASSIVDNTAEGSGKATSIEKARYTNMAYSSAMETINHLIGAFDLDYIEEAEYETMRIQIDEIINKLNRLYHYQIKREKSLKTQIKRG